MIRVGVFLATLLFLWTAAAYAQVETASVLGTVRDASGAVVEGATVTLTGGSCAPCVQATGDSGMVIFSVTPTAGEPLQLSATHPDYTVFSGTIGVQ